MTVAFLADYYAPHEIGGAERSAHRLAIELRKAGPEVVVVTPNYGAAAHEQLDGVTIVRLPFPERLIPGALARRRWMANPAVQIRYGVGIARQLRAHGAGVLHVQNSGFVAAGALASWLARVPFVVTVRDLAYLRPDPQSAAARAPGRHSLAWAIDGQWARIERRIKRMALSRAAEVVFVSRGLADVYGQSGLGAFARRARVVYNIGPDRRVGHRGTRDPMTVLFVGKLSEGKGLDVLYRAAALVRDTLPGVRFVLVGLPGVGYAPPPPEVASCFSLAGRLDSNAVAELMDAASVLAAPSVWPEPLSRVLLEAMQAGLPIVATAVGGTPEALEHGSSAWLVPPGDPEALADGLMRLLTDRAEASALSATARRRFDERFSPEAIIPQMLAVYDSARFRG